jgi:hypothetical protein
LRTIDSITTFIFVWIGGFYRQILGNFG